MDGLLKLDGISEWAKWVFLRHWTKSCKYLAKKLNKHLLKNGKEEICN